MAKLKDCKKYAECEWRKSVHTCPENCNHFKHKDEVIVIRCKDCKHGELDDGSMHWYLCRHNGCDWNEGEHFCSYGERQDK